MGEPRSFRMDRRSPEAARLREAVSKKLLDFLGNYSDEVLAEYIVVLVCNGKHQNQACDDLEAFLGEDSNTFVVWLWDYLSKEFMSKWTSEVESVGDHGDNLGREYKNSILADQHVHPVGPSQVEETALHKGPDPRSGNCTRATTNLSSLVTCSHEASSTAKRPLQHELQDQVPTDYSIAASVQSLSDSRWDKLQRVLRSVIAGKHIFSNLY
ncbi:hypothetical protein HPP92_010335 [Vanilla planifolia]|uniref:PWI domain-containing protein n=1 Tax=Vanilla planifolia TaxID=51239 RepID=A0A835R3H7_VANPL|nr:hypothetical protein HPP92_010335 [Vanilla planifolia]